MPDAPGLDEFKAIAPPPEAAEAKATPEDSVDPGQVSAIEGPHVVSNPED